MKLFLVIVTTALLLLGELLAGNLGLVLGLPLYGAVYFGVAYGRRSGVAGAAAAGLILDAVCFRECMTLVFLYPAIVAALLPLIRRERRRFPGAALLAGAAAGAAAVGANWLTAAVIGGALPGPDAVSLLISQTIAGAAFMLVFTLTADFLAAKCNLPRFRPAGIFRREEDDE